MPMEAGLFSGRGRLVAPGVTATAATPVLGAGLLSKGFNVSNAFDVQVNTEGAKVSTSFGINGLMAFGVLMAGLWAAGRYLPD